MAFEPKHIVNQIYRIHRDLIRLNLMLDNASEVELYRLRELKDSSLEEYPNFFAVALQSQAEKLTKKLERD